MTVRAGSTFGDDAFGSKGFGGCSPRGKAAPNGGIGAVMATAADFARAYDGAQATQLELRYQRTADGQEIVSMCGELDIATARHAYAYLRAVVDREQKGKVTLNLADLTFCDAAGLGVLAKVAGHARRRGRSVRLTAPSPALVRIMRITGMNEAFPEIGAPTLTMVPGPRQPSRAGTRQHPE